MEARFYSAAFLAASLLSLGASYRTQNFIVTADTPQLAQQIGDSAELYRRDLAIEWLGHELPAWQGPCPITAHVAPHLGAGGATSFMFDNRRPFGWQMTIQGSQARVLDSVLPHEVTHTIFATHFGRPLPRWADEGACTMVEHRSEKEKQERLLINFLTTGQGIAFNRMFAMKEYPPNILPLYSQGYSLARYLIAQGGRQKFVQFVGDGMDWNNWTAACKKHYGFGSLSNLQITWLDWVRNGCPQLQPGATLVAANDSASPRPLANSDRAPTPVRQVSSSSDGWYARQRDLARQSGQSVTPVPQQSSASSLARPQPIGTPRTTVLPPLANQPATMVPVNLPGSVSGYY